MTGWQRLLQVGESCDIRIAANQIPSIYDWSRGVFWLLYVCRSLLRCGVIMHVEKQTEQARTSRRMNGIGCRVVVFLHRGAA